MALLDRIAECTAHDLSGCVPFQVDGATVGWVREDIAERVTARRDGAPPPTLELRDTPTDDGVQAALTFRGGLADFDSRSDAMSRVVADLQEQQLVPRFGHELYPVVIRYGATPHFQLERAAMPTFGCRSFGVHMHGYVRRADGLHMWIARRSRTKGTFPGMLDNIVAGGQPIGLSRRQNLVKECAEEADIPEALAMQAVRTGAISYRMAVDRGLRNDTLFLYDLELPDDFRPRNTDGEVESFELWPIARVMERIASAPDFKFNCNLTILDFLLRHGCLDDHPEGDAVRAALTPHRDPESSAP